MISRRFIAQTLIAAAAGLAFTPAIASEARPKTPTTIAGGKVISAEEAKKHLDAKSATFIDMRSAMGYGKGRVPGAVSVTYREKSDFSANFDASLDGMDMEKLPQDKARPVIFYGHGDDGWKGYKGAVLAIKAGHKNVMFYRDGWAGWEAKSYPIER